MTLFDSYSYDGVSAGIWVIHRGPKSGGSLWRFLTVTLMMVWVLLKGPNTHRSQIWGLLLTSLGSYSHDGVSAAIGV